MAESLQAAALEELNRLAEDLKQQAGDAMAGVRKDVQEAGAGGLLDEVCGMLSDAMAHKKSKTEGWRVREVAAVCVKMLAAAPHVKGAPREEVQGALVRRHAFETDGRVLAVLNAGSDLPRRMTELEGGMTGGKGGDSSFGNGQAGGDKEKEAESGPVALMHATSETVESAVAGRGWIIHTFVKFDEFSINLSPNSIRNRRIYVQSSETRKCN